MQITLETTVKKFFSPQKNLFDQIMALRGDIYRELEGRCTQRIVLGEHSYFLKQHTGVGWKEILKNLLQLRWPVISAKNEWLAIQRLQTLAIATPTIVGKGCRGINPAKLQSFLMTKELTQTISLEDFCRHWRQQPPIFSLKQNLIKEVARITRTLHTHGINHRDLYICHFLLEKDLKKSPKLYLIDLHRAQLRKTTPIRWLIKDLVGLYFSSKDIGLTSRDLWRFVREYRKQSLRYIISEENVFWNNVKQRGNKMYQKHEK